MKSRKNQEQKFIFQLAVCGIENFEFIVSERAQVNPDNSRTMSALTFLLFLIECTAQRNTDKSSNLQLGLPKPWCYDSDMLNLHHDNDVKVVVW